MMSQEVEAEFERAQQRQADYYGLEDRLRILQEECAELIQACNKFLRKDVDHEKAETNLYEEIADVEICLMQVKYLLDGEYKVDSWRMSKLLRNNIRLETLISENKDFEETGYEE